MNNLTVLGARPVGVCVYTCVGTHVCFCVHVCCFYTSYHPWVPPTAVNAT